MVITFDDFTIPLNENAQAAKQFLAKKGISLDEPDYLEIRQMLSDKPGLLDKISALVRVSS